MARTNYQQLRRKKESERKNRRAAKLARRAQKGEVPEASAAGDDASPDPAVVPAEAPLK